MEQQLFLGPLRARDAGGLRVCVTGIPVSNPGLPLVTVVTPSLNQGRFIRETIESVLGQSYAAIEYLVIDGGSSDETIDILKGYGNRLTWVSEADGGQASAINKGWRGGRGAIVAYLNSDDTYLPGAVERAVSELSAHPEAGAVYGEGYHVDEAGRVLRRYPTEPFDLGRLAETCFICQPTVFLRREVVERVGYLDEALQFCMDYDLWIRVGRVTTFAQVSDFLASTRLHADTKTLGRRAQAHAEILRTVRQHFGYVPPSWVYAYAHAVLGSRRPQTAERDPSFMLRLIAVSGITFLRYNRGVPLSEFHRWGRWLRHGLRRLRERL
jgi:glycosyltransferase involved in cell wall biosynthesis